MPGGGGGGAGAGTIVEARCCCCCVTTPMDGARGAMTGFSGSLDSAEVLLVNSVLDD